VLLRNTLEDAGFAVHTAANGRDAVAQLQQLTAPPRLLLVDLYMPVMDGWDLIAYVKSRDDLARIPIGVQSANLEVTLPGGVAFVLPKPVDVEALIAMVRHHCGG